MLAKDMIAELNKKYPHFKTRLGKAGDPELNSIAVTFFPESTQSKNNMSPPLSAVPPDKPEKHLEKHDKELKPLSDNHQDAIQEQFGKK